MSESLDDARRLYENTLDRRLEVIADEKQRIYDAILKSASIARSWCDTDCAREVVDEVLEYFQSAGFQVIYETVKHGDTRVNLTIFGWAQSGLRLSRGRRNDPRS